MDSNVKTMKRRVKLVKADKLDKQLKGEKTHKLNQLEKELLFDELMFRIKSNDKTINEKELDFDFNNFNDFQLKTQITIDKTSLEIREKLDSMIESCPHRVNSKPNYEPNFEPNSEHYFKAIIELNDKYYSLLNELSFLETQLNYLKMKKEMIDNKVKSEHIPYKLSLWCQVCGNKANIEFQCCRNGHYCGYVHFKGDFMHIKYCTKRDKVVQPVELMSYETVLKKFVLMGRNRGVDINKILLNIIHEFNIK